MKSIEQSESIGVAMSLIVSNIYPYRFSSLSIYFLAAVRYIMCHWKNTLNINLPRLYIFQPGGLG